MEAFTSRNVDNSSSLRGLSKSTRPNKSPENFPTNKSPENFPNNLPGTPTNFLRSATGLTLQRTYNCSSLKELKICNKTSICPDVEDGAPKRPATNASARKCTLSQNGYGISRGVTTAKDILKNTQRSKASRAQGLILYLQQVLKLKFNFPREDKRKWPACRKIFRIFR